MRSGSRSPLRGQHREQMRELDHRPLEAAELGLGCPASAWPSCIAVSCWITGPPRHLRVARRPLEHRPGYAALVLLNEHGDDTRDQRVRCEPQPD